MKTRGAIVRKFGQPYEVVELEMDEPRTGEIMVKMVASGLCLSDEHVTEGAFPIRLPICGGHEGAGIVHKVGPNTPGWAVGDHVVLSVLPGCGRCHYCSDGHQNLCEMTANLWQGSRPEDPDSFRISYEGERVGQFCNIGTFCEYATVSVLSAVKVPADMPLDRACLIGCGVSTGWGSTVISAQVKPGQSVIVMGGGGVGNFAVQGAAHAGALHVIAVDPVESKRQAALDAGASHACASMDEAAALCRSLTHGRGADACAITLGTLRPEHLVEALEAVGKNGTVVITAIGSAESVPVNLSLFDITVQQKRIQGSMYGGVSPARDIVRLVELYQGGILKLDNMISAEYSLDQINQGYHDLKSGRNIRGIIRF